jgi:hypothetical protein
MSGRLRRRRADWRIQKCLAASNPSRTAPGPANNTTMLTRFRTAIETIAVAKLGGEARLDFLRFGICRCAFVDIACPRWRVRLPCSLTLTLSLSRCVPDRWPPLHALGPKTLKGLVNQSSAKQMVYELVTSIGRSLAGLASVSAVKAR